MLKIVYICVDKGCKKKKYLQKVNYFYLMKEKFLFSQVYLLFL
jgi:hypothetical protein